MCDIEVCDVQGGEEEDFIAMTTFSDIFKKLALRMGGLFILK